MAWDVIAAFLQRGLMGTLLGGFYFDAHVSLLVNTLHMYTWLFLVLVPFSLSLGVTETAEARLWTGIAYTALIFVVFLLIKVLNFRLHKAFGSEERPEPPESKKNNDSSDDEEGEKKPEKPTLPVDVVNSEQASTSPGGDSTDAKPAAGVTDGPLTEPPKEPVVPSASATSAPTNQVDADYILALALSRGEEIAPGGGGGGPEIHTYVDEFGEIQHYAFYDDVVGTSSGASRAAATPSIPSTYTHNFDANHTNVTGDYLGGEDPLDIPSPRRKPTSPPTGGTGEDKRPKLHIGPLTVPLRFQRRQLEETLDRDYTWLEAASAVVLATASAWLGWRLATGFYHEAAVFFCWVAVATGQYSLLKSPQPDAASQLQDNRITAFSRAFYFAAFGACVLALDAWANGDGPSTPSSVTLYGVTVNGPAASRFLRDFILVFVLWLPVVFALGLLPQVDTMLTWAFEQANVHLFGGSGALSLWAAVLEFVRSGGVIAIAAAVWYPLLREGGSEREIATSPQLSVGLALLTGLSYLHSRVPSDPMLLWPLVRRLVRRCRQGRRARRAATYALQPAEADDPVDTVQVDRLARDAIKALAIVVVVFAVHVSTVFYELTPELFTAFTITGCVVGGVTHYVIPRLRDPYPFQVFQEPVLKPAEHAAFEVSAATRTMWFERLYLVLAWSEAAIIYPVILLSAATMEIGELADKFGPGWAAVVVGLVGHKLLQGAFNRLTRQWAALVFTMVFFTADIRSHGDEGFLVGFLIGTVAVHKLEELVLKVWFILIYAAPWTIHWGSVAHVVLQPLSLPHTALYILEVIVATAFSAPLFPLVGSALFMLGYARPIKYWERSYRTQRVDNTQLRLVDSLAGTAAQANVNNLNSIFYEHLQSSLRQQLQAHIEAGRLGEPVAGDFFFLINDKLTALVHLIAIGNGWLSFQLRGVEFKGTYCHERELAAIYQTSYAQHGDNMLCGCGPCGPVPKLLSFRDMLACRWNTWQVANMALVLQSYSIALNPAASMFNAFELLQALIRGYVAAIIYYLVTSDQLDQWAVDPQITTALTPRGDPNYVDLDPLFTARLDDDFDSGRNGISVAAFSRVHGAWLKHCMAERANRGEGLPYLAVTDGDAAVPADNPVFRLSYALSTLARRSLLIEPSAAENMQTFLRRYYNMFKGDIRVTSTKDEWVYADVSILQKVVARALRMSLKLFLDYFASPDDLNDPALLYTTLQQYDRELVVCHEADPLWRQSVVRNIPQMISLRHQRAEDGVENPGLFVLMLTLRHTGFRVVKVNRESVRALWAGQQHELLFLGNDNPERGSIQQSQPVVRNLINQSCDLPIGYPIYVSPLTTSYASFWPDAMNFLPQRVRWWLA